jgi:hypothetical protein
MRICLKNGDKVVVGSVRLCVAEESQEVQKIRQRLSKQWSENEKKFNLEMKRIYEERLANPMYKNSKRVQKVIPEVSSAKVRSVLSRVLKEISQSQEGISDRLPHLTIKSLD